MEPHVKLQFKSCVIHEIPCKDEQRHVNEFYMAYLQSTLLKKSATFKMVETKFPHVEPIYIVITGGFFLDVNKFTWSLLNHSM